jgi:Dyp-type peroxidase family
LKADWDARVVPVYREPLHWYESGKVHLEELDRRRRQAQRPDPTLDRREIQGGVLKPQGSPGQPVRRGALMLMTITDADAARNFIRHHLDVHYDEGDGSTPTDGFFRTIGFTAAGLRRMGLAPCLIDHFPQEFREGMELRSGLLGDMRENHPRQWTLPPRNWPRLGLDADPFARARPPVEPSEVDFVIQVRSSKDDEAALIAEIERLAGLAAAGAPLQSYQLMRNRYVEGQSVDRDHFGFRDGISQPVPAEGIDDADQRKLDEVRLGELLLGYRNDRDDFAPKPFFSYPEWRRTQRQDSLALQFNGSFMVVRKLEQHVETFEKLIASETDRINREHKLPQPMTEARLKAKLFGRFPDGDPLIPPRSGDNDFDYDGDKAGEQCPFAAHIRRANPRDRFQGRRAPRLMRRGMSFEEDGRKGLIFMAYNASLAEQYETIQRWINGGNSSGVSASQNDPVLGIAPRTGALEKVDRVFRFVEGNEVVRVTIPEPFVALHWGIYLFIPSRSALDRLSRLAGGYRPMPDALEMTGRAVIRRLRKIEKLDAATIADEWKRLLEDFDAKDPTERNISPDVWAAMRLYYGGAVKIPGGVSALPVPWEKPPPADQPMVIAASRRLVMGILSDWETYSTEEQLRRIERNSGPIFVTQQPDNRYKSTLLQGKYDYQAESEATNAILMQYGKADGFAAGYEAGREVLEKFRNAAVAAGRPYYKIELRRQFLLPALGGLCRRWYGLPDGVHMHPDGWRWEPPEARVPPGPRCPGDFLSPSRNAFYPRPGSTVARFADVQGKAILAASRAFVRTHRRLGNGAQTGSVAREMFRTIRSNRVLARNLIGTMIGAIPPMDGNLRGILMEWLTEKTLWRHQAALRRALDDRPAAADVGKACAALYDPVSQAMCKRPAPDLLYRTATKSATPAFHDRRAGHRRRQPCVGIAAIIAQRPGEGRCLDRVRRHAPGSPSAKHAQPRLPGPRLPGAGDGDGRDHGDSGRAARGGTHQGPARLADRGGQWLAVSNLSARPAKNARSMAAKASRALSSSCAARWRSPTASAISASHRRVRASSRRDMRMSAERYAPSR